ncbi:LL-diaminopimelate aminotransferase [Candidatus Soleaferrea massiliensis]|uniref:LL-diaminopimelate aminotransferase n=1 Tax=Candidatus Soleaferrea massiliensis TaxID=1470354 RepID=UPI00058EEF68|nr:LL-diaminopimelate aminotransferase [Candidatus Soleaferrea massiliensis]
MARINENYLNLMESYLFSDIAKRVHAFCKQHPEQEVIRMGIGDVTLPLVPRVTEAMHRAVDEMGSKDTFRGYGPEQGYDFLREAIVSYYDRIGVGLTAGEVFVSDGAKSDVGNITDLFGRENTVLIPDPVYPVYVDTNLMNGRKIVYLDANEQNGFLPMPGDEQADIIYLCSPNNPTGAVYTREQLKVWVDYAIRRHAVILFDAAYEAFITDDRLPRSIYEIEGAKRCAIEFCSLSKTAGFTGTRCGYTVVPMELVLTVSDGQEITLNKLWNRRQTTKFNGVPYIIQRGAEAVFSEEGQKQIRENIAYYRANAKTIGNTLTKLGIPFTGGVNSPYIWMKCPNGMGSWEFFDFLLENIAVVGTPGAGFGRNGEGYFRLTSFGSIDTTEEAMTRFFNLLK